MMTVMILSRRLMYRDVGIDLPYVCVWPDVAAVSLIRLLAFLPTSENIGRRGVCISKHHGPQLKSFRSDFLSYSVSVRRCRLLFTSLDDPED